MESSLGENNDNFQPILGVETRGSKTELETLPRQTLPPVENISVENIVNMSISGSWAQAREDGPRAL